MHAMNINIKTLGTDLKLFNKNRDLLLGELAEKSFFNDTYRDEDENILPRRHATVISQYDDQNRIMATLTTLAEIASHIMNLAPHLYPTLRYLGDLPIVVENVKKIQIYNSLASSTRRTTGKAIIKKAKEIVKRFRERGIDPVLVTDIEHELKTTWKDTEDHAFTIRTTGYSDIQALITYADDSVEKIRIADAGLIIFPADDNDIKTLLPDQKPQKRRKSRESLYESLKVIETKIPIKGDIYRQEDVDLARFNFQKASAGKGHKQARRSKFKDSGITKLL